MGAFEKITISIPSEMAAALRESVEDGQYLTEGEIVRNALDDWVRSRVRAKARLQRLREELVKADEGPWYSEEEVSARLEASFAAREQA
jgi:antitoxin ParD1/3/4